jgi:hypothetical protein
MSSDPDKLRLAIGVFYEIDRLVEAVRGILGLGLTLDDIWLAGQKRLLGKDSALQHGLAGAGGDLSQLARRIVRFGELPGGIPLCGTNGPLQHLLLQTGSRSGRFFIGGEIGHVLEEHIQNGAIIATARTLAPATQDQCVRMLLRHSRHAVHAKEYRQLRGS